MNCMQGITHHESMDRLIWIESAGGPLILISDKSYNLWSGILKRSSYLENKIENANDFLNPAEADYGRACLIEDYLGIVNIGDDIALVLGDETLRTTVFHSVDNRVVIVRWYYGESEESVRSIDLNSIKNWEFSLTLKLSTDKQYLFDSARDASMLHKENNDYLPVSIKHGNYEIWTSIYEPDDKTKLIIHKFEETH